MAENDNRNKDPAERKKYQRTEEEDYGYYFYPERNEEKKEVKDLLWKGIWEGRGAADKFNCQANVSWCVNNNPMVKLMVRALKSHGCEVDLKKHVSCEPCLDMVNGGFDPSANQVVVCENRSTKRSICCSVLAHELLHAFDYCRAKVDFENLEHLACTEIRAANMMHCSYLSAVGSGVASPINIKQRHADCVHAKAMMSVLLVRNVTPETAKEAVDRVFPRCYADLEPVGRIPRRNSRDPERALLEGSYYGYAG